MALCASFLVLRVVLFATKRIVNCGCHGRFYQEKIDGASIVVSAVLFLLAGANLWAAWSGVSVAMSWRLPALLAYGGVFLLIVSRMLRRRRIPHQHPRAPSLPMEAALQGRRLEPGYGE